MRDLVGEFLIYLDCGLIHECVSPDTKEKPLIDDLAEGVRQIVRHPSREESVVPRRTTLKTLIRTAYDLLQHVIAQSDLLRHPNKLAPGRNSACREDGDP